MCRLRSRWAVALPIMRRWCCASCPGLLPFLRDYDCSYDDDNEQQYQQQHNHYYDDNPYPNIRFLFSFGFRLLATLYQPVNF